MFSISRSFSHYFKVTGSSPVQRRCIGQNMNVISAEEFFWCRLRACQHLIYLIWPFVIFLLNTFLNTCYTSRFNSSYQKWVFPTNLRSTLSLRCSLAPSSFRNPQFSMCSNPFSLEQLMSNRKKSIVTLLSRYVTARCCYIHAAFCLTLGHKWIIQENQSLYCDFKIKKKQFYQLSQIYIHLIL